MLQSLKKFFLKKPIARNYRFVLVGNKIITFSYIDAVRKNPLSKKIVDIINMKLQAFSDNKITSYCLFTSIMDEGTLSNYDADEILDICDMLFRLNCIYFTEFIEDIEPEYIPEWDINIEPKSGYLISVNL